MAENIEDMLRENEDLIDDPEEPNEDEDITDKDDPEEPNEDDNDSILNSVKKLLGIQKDYTDFDQDIILNINSAFSILTQLGVGPLEGFLIKGPEERFSDFVGDNTILLNIIPMYLYYKTRLGFDFSSLSAAMVENLKEQIKEMEWRLLYQVEIGVKLDKEVEIQNDG